ncbi:lycopene cyclase domain-containing protein [Microbacterium telephonicum]|uniref:Lycopene cyclase domain-containing protein n=1 Tax=Microbacterium telephonicum TaxID=1714841 RepID=A0A498C1D5_9MICO|nr:lycopene cyclase domain-containing protein [Microbacterium telephonicum]RLK49113.1 lycopene cyclase domain-containing protein [Microbacterium telephonicum]
MPGLYLAAILVSFAGVALLDARFRLAGATSPGRTVAATAIGTVFFLAWDAVGIAAGVFVKGESPLLLGVDLAPHLPVEEPVFLAFLCYLALVLHSAALRRLAARAQRRGRSGDAA